jgi:hypothetical protein
MSKKEFIFQEKAWNRTKEDLRLCFAVYNDFQKPCKVTIEDLNSAELKTSQQLRGFHRLIDILVPHFQEWTGEAWARDQVKSFIKKRVGFIRTLKGVSVVKSCREASIKEMFELIGEAIKFGDEMEIEGMVLRSDEERDLREYYQQEIELKND